MSKQYTAYELGIYQVTARRNTDALYQVVLAKHDLKAAEWRVLGLAVKNNPDGIRVTDMASIFGTKTTYMTYLLNVLRKKGFVEDASDPHDARVRLIVATADGKKAIELVEREMLESLKTNFNISEKNISILSDLLERMSKA